MHLLPKEHSIKWFKENASGFSGELLFEEPLFRYTYYRIGGPAQVLAIPRSQNDLQWLAQGITESQVPFFVMGQGSNLIVSDLGFPGLVIRVSRMNLEIELSPFLNGHTSGHRLKTGSSVAISTLLKRASQEGWAGLEFLTGIPGSLGGAVCMNAGTHLGEVQNRLKRVEAFQIAGVDPMDKTVAPLSATALIFEGDQLQFQYRKNLFLPHGSVVWSAEWEITKDDPARVKALIDETLARRKQTQPIDRPSCGSVFKNPKQPGLLAWQVIDQLGLRGKRIGDAQFSEKHSNFIVNLGKATAKDVRGLIDLAKEKAKTELDIVLEEEVISLGEI